MDTSELSARLQYLKDCSHLLAATAPVTSRYLMSQHNALALDNDLSILDTQRQTACGGCGTSMIVGWEATVEMRREKKTKCKQHLDRQRAIVYKCRTCNQITKLLVSPAPKLARILGTVPTPKPILQSQPGSVVPTSNHKKRSRASKHGGLKALLQKKKEEAEKSSEFDLMDFMKNTAN